MANKNTSKSEKSQAKTNSGTTSKKTKKKNSKSKYKKFFKNTLLGILIAGLICFVVGLGYLFAIIKNTPPLDVNAVLNLSQPSMLYDSNGEYIDNLPTEEERYVIKFDQMPQDLKDAYVAIEDERFYSHPGIDVRRILGALYRDAIYFVTGEGGLHGASTLTQQLIKNTILTNETTIERKVKEIYLSIQLEDKLTKDQILEAYLNTIPLGGMIYGVEAASQYFFEKPAIELTLPESAFIAGLTQAPTAYSPYNPANKEDPSTYLDRTQLVLSKMLELNYITDEEYASASTFVSNNEFAFSQSEINFRLNYEWFAYPAVDQVKRDLKNKYKYTDEELSKLMVNGGLKIYTTMDRRLQDSTQEILNDRDNLAVDGGYEEIDENGTPKLQASAVIMDYRNGHVKALVGGRGTQPAHSLNRAYSGLRSIASNTKPLTVYAPAIDTKKYTSSTPINDAGLPSDIQAQYPGWSPANWDATNHGYISSRDAIRWSKNIPSIIVANDIGVNTAISYGEKLGLVYGEASRVLATAALGEFANDPNDMDGGNTYLLAAAYGTFGNNGIYTEPKLYTRVVDATGKVLLEDESVQRQVFSPQTAYIMQDLLTGPVNFDAGGAKVPNMPTVGKTGTNDSVSDFWFSGLTPYYSASVWIGYDTHDAMSGYSSAAASLWGKIMAPAHEGLEYREIAERPSGITNVTVCKDSGKKATDLCSKDQRGGRVSTEMFIEGTEPSGYCDVHVTATVNKNNNKLATDQTPKSLVETRVFIRKPYASPYAIDYPYILPTVYDDTKAEPEKPTTPNNN
ncbi:transglycosylase domain-containing protein, partial [Clostridium sp.]|uniref:transglycosylase domain-containing protein n=1 Tax=Clostridium sp. TaxID=1506 RepID=UPI003F2CC87A